MNLSYRKGWLFKTSLLNCCILFCFLSSFAQRRGQFFKAAGTPVEPKVLIAWDRYNDAEALGILCHKIAKAYPKLVKITSIGKSYQGRDLWCLAITDYKHGNSLHKPAMYIQGNIHGNEIQGSEYALYIAWYLSENFNDNLYVKSLLKDKVFYIVPTLNPDARDYFMHVLGSPNGPRGTLYPIDKKGGNKLSSDNRNDLDKDGNLALMRKKNPYGIFVQDSIPMDMIKLPGDSIISKSGKIISKTPSNLHYDVMDEGYIINERDGKVELNGLYFAGDRATSHFNPEEYDPNRNWNYDWDKTPQKLTHGIGHPFSLQETRAVRDFFLSHPNICVAQSFHSGGGGTLYNGSSYRDWIKDSDKDDQSDLEVYKDLFSYSNKCFLGYGYAQQNEGNQRGEEIAWMFGKRGVYSFIHEFPAFWGYGLPGHIQTVLERSKKMNEDSVLLRFQNVMSSGLLLNDNFIPWHLYNHPIYGQVEIGGYKKGLKLEPGFMMEFEAHRNMIFCLNNAFESPKLEIKTGSINDLGNNHREVTINLVNTRLLPTHSGPDLKHNIVRPDWITIETNERIKLINQVHLQCGALLSAVSNKKNTFEIKNIPGHSITTIKCVVEGKGDLGIKVNSIKGGLVSSIIKVK